MIVTNTILTDFPGPSQHFDIDHLSSLLVSNDSGEYGYAQFESIFEEEGEEVRWIAIGQDARFNTVFTVANTSERENAIIEALSVRMENFEAPPAHLRIGCVPLPHTGGFEGIVLFDAVVNSELMAINQRVLSVPVMALGQKELQPFWGTLQFSAPGLHTFRVVIHYNTSAGRSSSAVSDLINFLVIPSAENVEIVLPDVDPFNDCSASR